MKTSSISVGGLILFVLSFLLVTPVFGVFKISSSLISFLCVVGYFLFRENFNRGVNVASLKLFISLSLIVSLSLLTTGNIKDWASSFIFISSLIFAYNVDEKTLVSFVKLSTIFIGILLFGALISLLYKLSGGSELFFIENPDGRLNYFYPFSFSNSVWSSLLRPSGIYDEPGAFSFFICGLVTLRVLTKSNVRITTMILLLGLITLSVAHVVFTIIYFLSFKWNLKRLMLAGLVVFCGFLVVKSTSNRSLIYNTFFIRFVITESGEFHGDNRSVNFMNALDLIREKPLRIVTGINDDEQVIKDGEFGANPLGFVLNYGFVLSLPYYIVLMVFISALKNGRKYLVVFAFGLLLLQRDYLYVVSYATITSVILVLYIKRKTDKWILN